MSNRNSGTAPLGECSLRKHLIILSSNFLFFTLYDILESACPYKILVAIHVVAFEVKINVIQVIYKQEQHLVVSIPVYVDWCKNQWM